MNNNNQLDFIIVLLFILMFAVMGAIFAQEQNEATNGKGWCWTFGEGIESMRECE